MQITSLKIHTAAVDRQYATVIGHRSQSDRERGQQQSYGVLFTSSARR